MKKEILIKNIQAASKNQLCDLVIKNINVVDVFQSSTFIADVAINNGYFVGLGNYSGITEIDGTGKYICPGLIDGHAHIESSLTTPMEYYKAALVHGVTSMIVDPHEIANVLGIDGIKAMMDSSLNLPFDYYYMLPSCVPSTPFENSGAILSNDDLRSLYENTNTLGLAEVMDEPSVSNCSPDMIDKLYEALSQNKVIDGHCAGFNIDQLNTYATAHIYSDHECEKADEVEDRIRRGMYVLIREGTVAKNLDSLINCASIFNSRRLCFCTDDKHIDEIINYGSIDESIRKSINKGIYPEIAIQMATLNTSECYKLKSKGAIAPGYIADFIILDSLSDFKISSVYKNGELVVSNNKLVNSAVKSKHSINIDSTINFKPLTLDDFKISIKNKTKLNVIEIIPNKLESKHITFPLNQPANNEEFIYTSEKDLLKVAVIERHKATGNIGLGVIKGLNIEKGAIATTIAHDSHNLIVTGTNDEDMLLACNYLKEIGGGIVIVCNSKIIASVPLEIAGLMTSRDTSELLKDLEHLNKSVLTIAPNLTFNPFLTLSFLSLPVIPNLKITDKGLFDVTSFSFIPVAQ